MQKLKPNTINVKKLIAEDTMIESQFIIFNILLHCLLWFGQFARYDHQFAPKNLSEKDVALVISNCYAEFTEYVPRRDIFVEWGKMKNPNIIAYCLQNKITINNRYLFQVGFEKNNGIPIQHVIMHEMGHAYGLCHYDGTLLMQPVYNFDNFDPIYLSTQDINNLIQRFKR